MTNPNLIMTYETSKFVLPSGSTLKILYKALTTTAALSFETFAGTDYQVPTGKKFTVLEVITGGQTGLITYTEDTSANSGAGTVLLKNNDIVAVAGYYNHFVYPYGVVSFAASKYITGVNTNTGTQNVYIIGIEDDA